MTKIRIRVAKNKIFLETKATLLFCDLAMKKKKNVIVQDCRMNFLYPVLQEALAVVGLPLLKQQKN